MTYSVDNVDAEMATKGKCVVLTIQEKLQVVNLVDRGSSYESVAVRFNIGKSDVWKEHEWVKQFMADFLNDCHSNNAKKCCIIQRSSCEDVDKELHLWVLQQGTVGTPISGLLLQTKVKMFYSQFHPDDNKFKDISKGTVYIG